MENQKRKREENEDEKSLKKTSNKLWEKKYNLFDDRLSDFKIILESEEFLLTTKLAACETLPNLSSTIVENLSDTSMLLPHKNLEIVDLVFYIESCKWTIKRDFDFLDSYSDAFLMELWKFEHQYGCIITRGLYIDQINKRLNNPNNNMSTILMIYQQAEQFHDEIIKSQVDQVFARKKPRLLKYIVDVETQSTPSTQGVLASKIYLETEKKSPEDFLGQSEWLRDFKSLADKLFIRHHEKAFSSTYCDLCEEIHDFVLPSGRTVKIFIQETVHIGWQTSLLKILIFTGKGFHLAPLPASFKEKFSIM